MTFPGRLTSRALDRCGRPPRLERCLDDDVVSRNTCKGLAASVGLVWNFCFYKFFVHAV